MKSLIIAEKPSVARDIASALGRMKKHEDWFENDSYLVCSAVGHLVELFMPEDLDKKLKAWRLQSLPIIPAKFELKPIAKTKDRFDLIRRLIKREDVGEVINACDAGREGELIFTYAYELAKGRKPVRRLWMQSMTGEGIRSAFSRLRQDGELSPLRDAARCRSEADWLIGINGTRAVTIRMMGNRRQKGQLTTVGRVQTPTLTLVVERERQIRGFVARTYWRVEGEFSISSGVYRGFWQSPAFRKTEGDPEARADRLWDSESAQRILREARACPTGLVSEERKRTQQIAPRLYDLTSLQREANNRFGLPAAVTLRIAQSLYEKHKAITYPRTDSRALPEDYLPTCRETLGALRSSYQSANAPLENGWVRPNRRIFNNKEVSDHFAIIPTVETPARMTADEEKIYDMITRRFIAVFYPPAEYDVTVRLTDVGGHVFKTEGKVLAVPGWLDVYGRAASGDALPGLSPADGTPAKAAVRSVCLLEESTKPPARFTEATLLSAMEGAGKLLDDEELALAMKDKGLGTPATRAAIIDHLLHEKYLEREKRDLLPTPKAEGLVDFLRAIGIETLTSPSLTGEWEHKLHQIENRTLTRDAFMTEIAQLTQRFINQVKEFEEKPEDARVTSVTSPTDGKPMIETLRAFQSQDGEIKIYKTIGNRSISEEEMGELLRERQIGPLEGFRSKLGKPYTAILRLNESNRIEFQFPNRTGTPPGPANGNESAEPEALDLSTLTQVGLSPLDGAPVYETPSGFFCERSLRGDRTGFRLSRTLLDCTLPTDQVRKLLDTKRTDLIPNFRSKRTRRTFSARLVLKDKGELGFEFEPRPAGSKRPQSKRRTKPGADTDAN